MKRVELGKQWSKGAESIIYHIIDSYHRFRFGQVWLILVILGDAPPPKVLGGCHFPMGSVHTNNPPPLRYAPELKQRKRINLIEKMLKQNLNLRMK